MDSISMEQLEQMRQEDIDFFARRYVELFANDFEKITEEQKQDFYLEIKQKLLINAPKYVVDNSKLFNAAAESRITEIILSDYNYNDREVRIHELVHSYNHVQTGAKSNGLRDFENDFVLKNLDEGSTELIAQLIVGNDKLESTGYSSDVRLANFVRHLVGTKTFMQATRCNPQLLSSTLDQLLGTKNFLQQLETIRDNEEKLIADSFGEDTWGRKVSYETQLLSKLKVEVQRGNDPVSLLYRQIQKSGNLELMTNFLNVDNKYNYDIAFHDSISQRIEVAPNEQTLSSVQQQQIIEELNFIKDSSEEIDVLRTELLKFMYDRIEIQKHFVNSSNFNWGILKPTEEDIKFFENFKSSLDGRNVRFGGVIGITGPGCRIRELDNVSSMVNREYANKIWIDGLGFDELTDKRLEIIAEMINIRQQIDLLEEWKIYIRNCFLNEEFPWITTDEELDAITDKLQEELENKERNILNKYKQGKNNINESSNEKESIVDSTIVISKKQIEDVLKIHLDIVRGYQHQVVNGQEIYMPVTKTAQELSQEQGRLFQRIEQLYENGEMDFKTKRAMQSQLTVEIEKLKEQVSESAQKKIAENRPETREELTSRMEQIRSQIKKVNDEMRSLHPEVKYREDFQKFSDSASKLEELDRLWSLESEVRKKIQIIDDKKTQEQREHNSSIQQVENLMGFRITSTKGYSVDLNVHNGIPVVIPKSVSELSQEQGKINQKLDELFYEGEIDLKTKQKLTMAVIHQYDAMKSKAPKSTTSSTRDDSNIMQEEQQTQTQVQHPYINSEVREQVVERETKKKYLYDEMTPEEQKRFDSRFQSQRKKQQTEKSNTSDKEKLEEERRNLRRKQFEERARAMGLNFEQIPNLDSIFAEQEIIEQMGREREQFEEIDDHGMHM